MHICTRNLTHSVILRVADGFNGVVQIDGDKWREQRRFSLHVLRDFGVGRALMEEKIMREVDRLMKYFDAQCRPDGRSEPIELTKPISICIGNIINDILFGKTFPHVSESSLSDGNQLLHGNCSVQVWLEYRFCIQNDLLKRVKVH